MYIYIAIYMYLYVSNMLTNTSANTTTNTLSCQEWHCQKTAFIRSGAPLLARKGVRKALHKRYS